MKANATISRTYRTKHSGTYEKGQRVEAMRDADEPDLVVVSTPPAARTVSALKFHGWLLAADLVSFDR